MLFWHHSVRILLGFETDIIARILGCSKEGKRAITLHNQGYWWALQAIKWWVFTKIKHSKIGLVAIPASSKCGWSGRQRPKRSRGFPRGKTWCEYNPNDPEEWKDTAAACSSILWPAKKHKTKNYMYSFLIVPSLHCCRFSVSGKKWSHLLSQNLTFIKILTRLIHNTDFNFQDIIF